jgi:hypothetical protein
LTVLRFISQWLSCSTPGISPVRWRGTPLHARSVSSRLKMLRDRRDQLRESVGPVRADLNRRIFFSRRRVGWCEFSARLFSTRVLPMFHARQDLTFGGTITSEFIGNNHSRNVLQPFQQFPEKSLGGLCVASALDQDIKHVAMLIHRTPQIVLLPIDLEKNLVQMPFVPTTRATTTRLIGIRLPERANTIGVWFRSSRPLLVVRRPLFHIAKTEREAKIQPYGVAHDFRREAETFVVGGSGACFHKAILTYCSATLPS